MPGWVGGWYLVQEIVEGESAFPGKASPEAAEALGVVEQPEDAKRYPNIVQQFSMLNSVGKIGIRIAKACESEIPLLDRKSVV